MGKKDRCVVFGCNNDRLFPEKYTVKFSFCPKSARKHWASAPPRHPIIPLKSNKFNMAAVSVKRSITDPFISSQRGPLTRASTVFRIRYEINDSLGSSWKLILPVFFLFFLVFFFFFVFFLRTVNFGNNFGNCEFSFSPCRQPGVWLHVNTN